MAGSVTGNVKSYIKKPTPALIFVLAVIVVTARVLDLATIDTLVIFMYFIAIAASLNIIMGYAGYVSFGHCVFLGIGGYVYALAVYYIPAMNALQKTG